MADASLDQYLASGDTSSKGAAHIYTFRGFDWVSCAHDDECGKRVKVKGDKCPAHA